ncbi:hypothetical protein [Pseudomonas viridiflava]|uniref:hypothetical protein n=1 Tax=Pseudomonas viridiflava TaxID=33069 RepID=UPI0005B700FB|nr:hypothetical protein [Pseudomonas viridiflava]KIQ36436.1 hypothetical protein RT94_05305 [Pseudomonas viridiflava]
MTARFTVQSNETEQVESSTQIESPVKKPTIWYVFEEAFEHYKCESEDMALRLAKGLQEIVDLNNYNETKQAADAKHYEVNKELVIAKSKLASETLNTYIDKKSTPTPSAAQSEDNLEVSLIKQKSIIKRPKLKF